MDKGHSLMQSLVLPTQPYDKGAGVCSASHKGNKTTLLKFYCRNMS